MNLDLGEENVAQYSKLPANHITEQAEVLPLAIWKALLKSALACPPEARSELQWFCGYVVRYVVSSLRFAHTRRASFAVDKSDDTMDVWHVYKGKSEGGIPFFVPLPSHVFPEAPLMLELRSHASANKLTNIFIPAAASISGSPCDLKLVPAKAAHGSFIKTLRAIIVDLGFPESLADLIVSYSFRRFLATVADVMGMDDSEKNSLGNWKDRVGGRNRPESVHVRYSAERLRASASAKRMCLLGLSHAFKYRPDVSEFPKLAGLRAHVQKIREHAASHLEWGMGAAAFPQIAVAHDAKESVAEVCPESSLTLTSAADNCEDGNDEDDDSDLDADSLSDGDSEQDEALEDTSSIAWTSPPKKGKIHFCLDGARPPLLPTDSCHGLD